MDGFPFVKSRTCSDDGTSKCRLVLVRSIGIYFVFRFAPGMGTSPILPLVLYGLLVPRWKHKYDMDKIRTTRELGPSARRWRRGLDAHVTWDRPITKAIRSMGLSILLPCFCNLPRPLRWSRQNYVEYRCLVFMGLEQNISIWNRKLPLPLPLPFRARRRRRRRRNAGPGRTTRASAVCSP